MSMEDNQERKKKFEPLQGEQLKYADELLEELHPLDHIPLCTAFPYLGCLTGCGISEYPRPRKSAEEGENHSLDQETNEPLLKKKQTMTIGGKEVAKKAKKKKKNNMGNSEMVKARPLSQLGYGIVSYIDILWTLIRVFFLFSLILAPTMHHYHGGSGYQTINKDLVQYEQGMLGNMGYSSVQCALIPLDVGKINLQCPYGKIGAIYDFGVNLSDATSSNCAGNDAISKCKPDSTKWNADMEKAVGTQTALIAYTDYKQLYTSSANKASCNVAGESRLFVQYNCVQSVENQQMKYNQMCLIVSSACFVALLFTLAIRQMYQGGKLDQKSWDLCTITAGDYTVEFEFNEKAYDQWKTENYDGKQEEISPALALKQHMKEEVESILNEWKADPKAEELAAEEKQKKKAKRGKKDKKEKKEKKEKEEIQTHVADIVFSFNNHDLILALRARGQKIATNNFDGMRAENAKIEKLIAEKRVDFMVPTGAFITFESDNSVLAALANQSERTLLGQEFRVKSASEPTDIIWENRHYTARDYIIRQLIAAVIVFALLFCSFLMIYQISMYSAKMAATFPPTDCQGIVNSYDDLFQAYAVDDYDYVIAANADDSDRAVQSSGTLQCFCKQEKIDNPTTYLTESYGQVDGAAICGVFFEQVGTVYMWTSALSYLLIGINYILRTVCIMLVNWIGYPTETERLSKTTSVTFYVQFFNSAFLLLLVNADLSEQPFSFGLVGGFMGDFNGAWFRTIGNVIVGAMFFNLYYPLIEAFGYGGLRWFGRCRDRGCCMSNPTKKTSIQAYLDSYSGPIYYMHYKYSSIMTIAFITFIYGFGMPILFPIACASFTVLYFVEKYLLFYGYRLPPMYDERLSQDVLNKLQFAPILYIGFGYWMASNLQLLNNGFLGHITSTDNVFETGHTYGSVFHKEGNSGFLWPMLLVFFFLLIIFFMGHCLDELLLSCLDKCCGVARPEEELDEDIANYWASLDENDRTWSIEEEMNARNLCTSKILTDEQFERLQNTPMTKKKTLQGVHSYDILANPLYLDDFQYVSASEPNRDEIIIDDDDNEGNDCTQSDIVRVCLNLAYLTQKEAAEFDFDENKLRENDGKGYTNPLN